MGDKTKPMRNWIFTVTALAGNGASMPVAADDERLPSLNCEVGPLKKPYGGNPWLVYACDDQRAIVVVSDQGNPATPFYFILYVKPDGQRRLYGEGAGAKSATQPAFDELSTITLDAVNQSLKATALCAAA